VSGIKGDRSVGIARRAISGSPGSSIQWFGRFAVAEPPADRHFLAASELAGAVCTVLEAGAAGLIIYLPGPGAYDSSCLDALMRAAKRARGWGTWLRLVIPDPALRQVFRLVALDEVMPVHTSLMAAVAAAAREAAVAEAGGS
jgi:anti-sigma B factor antagonist